MHIAKGIYIKAKKVNNSKIEGVLLYVKDKLRHSPLFIDSTASLFDFSLLGIHAKVGLNIYERLGKNHMNSLVTPTPFHNTQETRLHVVAY